jgi:site-specific recombinase XerD
MNLIRQTFKLYLNQAGVSPATSRNYLSDLNHFLSWLSLETRKTHHPLPLSPAALPTALSSKMIKKYYFYLVENQVPTATVRRRFSSLRKWGQQITASDWIAANPFLTANYPQVPHPLRDISTSDIFRKFKTSLEKEGTNPSTIRNYLSDVRHFVTWLEAQ